MSNESTKPHGPAAERPTGKEVPSRESVPQGTIEPDREESTSTGPKDWNDMVTHTGEARGLADTGYSSLQPDAPTVGAAARGHEIEKDLAYHSSVPQSGNGPD
jgi:hypothetical protein